MGLFGSPEGPPEAPKKISRPIKNESGVPRELLFPGLGHVWPLTMCGLKLQLFELLG